MTGYDAGRAVQVRQMREGTWRMRRKIFTVLFALLFLAGFGILAYPTISNQWNNYRQSRLISNYKEITEKTDTEDFDREWANAEAYNDSITVNQPMSGDVFSEGGQEDKTSEYWKVLNIAGDGMMGYISIPKIMWSWPFTMARPTTSCRRELVTSRGRSSPSAARETTLCWQPTGDCQAPGCLRIWTSWKRATSSISTSSIKHWLIRVDQILPMVDKDDTEALSEALAIEDGQDYVTLFTCTPYGVNTHRLLVRGTRVEYHEEETAATPANTAKDLLEDYYMFFLIGGVAVTVIAIGVIRLILRRKKKRGRSGTLQK